MQLTEGMALLSWWRKSVVGMRQKKMGTDLVQREVLDDGKEEKQTKIDGGKDSDEKQRRQVAVPLLKM
jgi:hypothetical protein